MRLHLNIVDVEELSLLSTINIRHKTILSLVSVHFLNRWALLTVHSMRSTLSSAYAPSGKLNTTYSLLKTLLESIVG